MLQPRMYLPFSTFYLKWLLYILLKSLKCVSRISLISNFIDKYTYIHYYVIPCIISSNRHKDVFCWSNFSSFYSDKPSKRKSLVSLIFLINISVYIVAEMSDNLEQFQVPKIIFYSARHIVITVICIFDMIEMGFLFLHYSGTVCRDHLASWKFLKLKIFLLAAPLLVSWLKAAFI